MVRGPLSGAWLMHRALMAKGTEMRRLGNSRGEGKIGLLISLALLLSAAYAAYVLIPIKVRTYEFYDSMVSEARFGAVRNRDEKVHARLMKKARQLQIPLTGENLEIKRDGGQYIVIAHYTIPVDLAVYKTEWVYHEKATAPIF
jgi:hypothetical protein